MTIDIIDYCCFSYDAMLISVDVHLLRGKKKPLNVEADALVETLKHCAQSALGTDPSFVPGICCNPGRWISGHLGGDADYGGDSSAVQDQLTNVRQIQASGYAIAALLGNGSVVTWGAPNFGGDSSAVQDQLRDVQQIQASRYAFAALLGNGSVVTWGDPAVGGDCSAVHGQLNNVQQIQASSRAFAAILSDGSVEQEQDIKPCLPQKSRFALAWAAQHGQVSILEQLLSLGTSTTSEEGWALELLGPEVCYDNLRKLLRIAKSKTTDPSGRTPLQAAAVAGRKKCLGVLLRAGAWDSEPKQPQVEAWLEHWKLDREALMRDEEPAPPPEPAAAAEVEAAEKDLTAEFEAKQLALAKLQMAIAKRGAGEVWRLLTDDAYEAYFDLDPLGSETGNVVDLRSR
eukprot:s3638_g3.t1